jgi:DNA-binding GntR family transcriptional regulator
MTRIAPTALYQEVAERLRQRIYAHEIEPGAWIDEQAIAAQYGISRTPLREALKVLASEGLVTLKPRRGCYVTELSVDDLNDIFPLLGVLEGRCAFEATRKAGAAELRLLAEIHQRLEDAAARRQTDRFFEANQVFHSTVQSLAGNRWAKQMIEDLRKVVKLSRVLSLSLTGRLERSLAEHRAIMQAMQAGDAAAAERAMVAHLDSARAALIRDIQAARSAARAA